MTAAVAGAGIGLQAGAGLEAVHLRHHHVQQDQIRDGTLRDGDGVLAAPRGEQAVAVALERLIEDLKVRGVVVHQQDLRSVRLGFTSTWSITSPANRPAR